MAASLCTSLQPFRMLKVSDFFLGGRGREGGSWRGNRNTNWSECLGKTMAALLWPARKKKNNSSVTEAKDDNDDEQMLLLMLMMIMTMTILQ